MTFIEEKSQFCLTLYMTFIEEKKVIFKSVSLRFQKHLRHFAFFCLASRVSMELGNRTANEPGLFF